MKNVLLVSIAFSPNVGGIETHFDDLVSALDTRGWKVDVLTYKPITVSVKAPVFERRGRNISVYRIPWFHGVFYKLVNKPILEFIFLTPPLFITLPILLLIKARSTKVIHSHGLVAGFVSVFWGKVFGKRVIATTHSIYHFPESGLYRMFAKWIFSNSDVILTLSRQSKREIESLEISPEKIKVFTYWVDLEKFTTMNKEQKTINRRKLGWKDKFVVLFVGRLVPEKGVNELLEAAKDWDRNITLVIAGTGPLEERIKKYEVGMDSVSGNGKNLIYLGKIDNKNLPKYYSAANLVIVPSIHEEGFGRVILEALACGTPVIGSNRGAIPEAMDESVGKLIDVTPENIKKAVEYYYENPGVRNNLSKNARRFAETHYSEKNIESIIRSYNNED